jgi:UDP-GlcNAc:undecaprenyl-phosphate/decaprenyl-phosphate GlcNAc-1-phosphate transferase
VYSAVVLGVTSFIIALLATPAIRDFALALGCVDRPDGFRKSHPSPVPRIGGIPIVLAYLVAFGVLAVFPPSPMWSGLADGIRLFPAVALVFVVGLVDDLRRLTPWQKLAGQAAASSLAIAGGLRITHLVGYEVPALLSVAATMIWLIGCANAFNLIDGVDGLAAGAGLFAATTMLIAALLQNNLALVLATAPLVGALLGFLRFNFNPATIFLGDSGSLVIGFLLGCLGVTWSQKSATVLGLTAPLMALAIPLLDTCLAIARRFITNQPIFSPDRGHIHHRLLDRGFTPRRVALSLYAACGLAAALSLTLSVSETQMAGPVVVLFCAFTWLGVQHLGYVEFDLAGRLFMDGSFRRLVNCQLELRSFDTAIATADNPQTRWEVVLRAARQLGFCRVSAKLAGRQFEEWLTVPDRLWSIRILLEDDDYVELCRAANQPNNSAAVAPFADAILRSLSTPMGVSRTPSNVPGAVPERGTYVVLQGQTSVGKSVL